VTAERDCEAPLRPAGRPRPLLARSLGAIRFGSASPGANDHEHVSGQLQRPQKSARFQAHARRGLRGVVWGRFFDFLLDHPPGISIPFHLPSEQISDAPLGLDDLRRTRVALEFAAKAEDLHVYASIEHVFVDSSRL
jgi:hypothetical protein